MKAGQWKQLRHHFETLCELPLEKREEALAGLEIDDEIRSRLRRMLDADAGDRLQDGIAEQAPQLQRQAAMQADAEDPRIGHRLGAWRIVVPIGMGGMGKVYRAQRDDGRFDVEVAIKIAARGFEPERFQREREVLARLQHPGIARLLDGGECEDGRPWLAMEFVAGSTIDRHCRGGKLGPLERVRLVREAACAVAYAHARAVLHRDLKPDNILVQPDGQPKLLDFGIAKLLDSDSDADQTSARFFTPRYAAPEQIAGEAATTATDVFSLAVVLYELLAGRHPFAPDGEKDLARRVLTGEALPLRRALDLTSAIGLRLGSRQRDLEAVLMKALRRESAERYGSMDAFVRELDRILQDRPVQTRPPPATERVLRWARRNPLAFGGLTLGAASLLLGAGLALWQAREANRQRDTAIQEAQRAERVASFLSDIFHAPNPAQSRGGEVSARELLDRGRERIGKELADDPVLRRRLQSVIADTYRSLGDLDQAESLLKQAIADSSSEPDAHLLMDLGWVHAYQGRFDESAARLREAVALARADGDIATQIDAMRRLATPLLNLARLDEAEQVVTEALSLSKLRDPPDEDGEVSLRGLLANIAYNRGDLDRAEQLFREELAARERVHGDDHTGTALSLNNLASVAFRRGNLKTAEQSYGRAIEINRRYFGVENEQVAQQTRNLALVLRREGRAGESLRLVRSAAGMLAKWSGEEHPGTVAARLDALELALLMGESHPPEGLLLAGVAAKMKPGSRNECRWRLLRFWSQNGDDLAMVQDARDCLSAAGAPAVMLGVADLQEARIRHAKHEDVAELVAEASRKLATIVPPDPLLAAAFEPLQAPDQGSRAIAR